MAHVERIPLGSVEEVQDLFSFPNNRHTLCFRKQKLDETIAHYLNASIKRDGFIDSTASVEVEAGTVFADVRGSAAEAYAKLLPEYLRIGQLGLNASASLWNENKWCYNWTFFLPHGVSMTQHYSVQLLHFPPDYVLERDQDYLLAHTTLRWAALLKENGASDDETDRFQNIIDIAPIAAPSDDGKNLDGVYSFYSDYINGLLGLWVPASAGGVRPLVAFGSPVRTWLKDEHGLDLKVLDLGKLDLPSGMQVPVLAANHPSYIFYTKNRQDNPNTPEDERFLAAMCIMQQDLIAAGWQVVMGKNPTAKPEDVLDGCRDKWKWSSPENQQRICQLTREQVFKEKPDDYCASLSPLDKDICDSLLRPITADYDEVEKLREKIGAQESKELESVRDSWFNIARQRRLTSGYRCA